MCPEASPREPKGQLPFKGPTPVDQEGDSFIYTEKGKERKNIQIPPTFPHRHRLHIYITSPVTCSHRIMYYPFVAVTVQFYISCDYLINIHFCPTPLHESRNHICFYL